MLYIYIYIYIYIYYRVIFCSYLSAWNIFGAYFSIAFRSFGFSCYFLKQFVLITCSVFFQHLLHLLFTFCIFGEHPLASSGLKMSANRSWMFQRTFRGLWTGNCLLEKYSIRLPRIFCDFWVTSGCVCVHSNLIRFFAFYIFTLSSAYTCKYISRVSIHQSLFFPVWKQYQFLERQNVYVEISEFEIITRTCRV